MNLNLGPKLKEAIWDSEAVVTIRQSFAELDPKMQTYTLFGSLAALILVMLGGLLFLLSSVYSIKTEMADTQESIRMLTNSADKMDELRQKIRSQGASAGDDMGLSASTPLTEVVEKVAGRSAIGKDSLELPSAASGSSLEVKLNKISLRQLVRFMFYVENSRSEVSFQELNVDTKSDPEGYMWAVLKLAREPKGLKP